MHQWLLTFHVTCIFAFKIYISHSSKCNHCIMCILIWSTLMKSRLQKWPNHWLHERLCVCMCDRVKEWETELKKNQTTFWTKQCAKNLRWRKIVTVAQRVGSQHTKQKRKGAKHRDWISFLLFPAKDMRRESQCRKLARHKWGMTWINYSITSFSTRQERI